MLGRKQRQGQENPKDNQKTKATYEHKYKQRETPQLTQGKWKMLGKKTQDHDRLYSDNDPVQMQIFAHLKAS